MTGERGKACTITSRHWLALRRGCASQDATACILDSNMGGTEALAGPDCGKPPVFPACRPGTHWCHGH